MKEIKDYLHLYKGCRVQVKDKSIVTFCGVSYDENGQYFVHLMSHKFGYYINLIDDIKPILVPLEKMTEDDWRELRKYDYNSNPANRLTAEGTRYLLSKSFDIFNLIESGLAIDKTTLKKQAQ